MIVFSLFDCGGVSSSKRDNILARPDLSNLLGPSCPFLFSVLSCHRSVPKRLCHFPLLVWRVAWLPPFVTTLAFLTFVPGKGVARPSGRVAAAVQPPCFMLTVSIYWRYFPLLQIIDWMDRLLYLGKTIWCHHRAAQAATIRRCAAREHPTKNIIHFSSTLLYPVSLLFGCRDDHHGNPNSND